MLRNIRVLLLAVVLAACVCCADPDAKYTALPGGSRDKGGFVAHTQANATWEWARDLDSKTDEELPRIPWEIVKEQAVLLFEKNAKAGTGDIWWVGVPVHFDENGSVFNEKNAKSQTRFIEVTGAPGQKRLFTLLKVTQLRGKWVFHAVRTWEEGPR